MDYLYDNSFEGLLTCIYYSYKYEKASGIYDKNSYQQSILNEYQIINTNPQLSDIVYNAIDKKISNEAILHIYYTFLSCLPEKENKILRFIEFCFKKGKVAVDMYSHDDVLPIRETSRRVMGEAHGFLGILRFSDIGGVLYAKCNPDNNIIPIITEHFADRYKYERFIIHDEKRKIASVYTNNEWQLIDASTINIGELSKDEKQFQKLWTNYFNTMAIEARINKNLQFQNVPVRYRKNIIEFKNLV